MDDTRTCPYCAEEIPAAAIRCRYCRSRLATFDPGQWYRDRPERRLSGVAAALARPLTAPVALVRAGFVVLTFVHLAGPILYAALWALIPFKAGEASPLEHALAWVRGLLAQVRGDGPARPGTHGVVAGRDAPP
jgi:phage shock protein PspC (stress-responsive transcriptional regulator)